MLDEIINYVQSLQRQIEVSRPPLLPCCLFPLCPFSRNCNTKNTNSSSSYVRKIYIDFLDAPSHSTDMVSRNDRLMVLQFLSMKLAAVNPGMDCTVDDFLCKQVGKFYWIVAGTQSNFLGFFVRLQSFTEHVQNDNSQVL